jgi:hypothetical protein
MNLKHLINELHQKIKEFHDIVKKEVFYLSKCKLSVIKSNGDLDIMPLSMAIFFLRNSLRQMGKSKVNLSEFNKLVANLKNLFQTFIDTPELIEFDKGEDLFTTLNKEKSLSIFKSIYNSFLKERLNEKRLNNKCDELKESLIDFDTFKEKFRELNIKFRDLNHLKVKCEKHKKLLKKGDLEKLNGDELIDFRIFRSFSPLDSYSEYVIDIEKEKVVKLEEK